MARPRGLGSRGFPLRLSIFRFLGRATERGLWLFARTQTYRGLRIGVLGVDGDRRDALFAKIRGALDLIRTRAPIRYTRVCRDVTGVLVLPTVEYARGGAGPGLRTCFLSDAFVEASTISPGQVASTIVHEAVHIRLDRCDIEVTSANRVRIERICQRAQAEFGQGLPDDPAVLSDAEKSLALSPAVWTNENLESLDEASLARQGLPRWVASIIAWRRRAT